jgi:general secretion pathway protein M
VSAGDRPQAATIAALKARWAQLTPRDRSLLALAATVIALYLLWAVAVAPALVTLRRAPVQLAALQAQEQQMQLLAQVAKGLRGAQPVPPAQAAQALTAATTRLGAQAKVSLQGERAVLTVQGVTAPQLLAWLAEVRAGARGRVSEATLTQSGQGAYSGSLTVVIGAAP